MRFQWGEKPFRKYNESHKRFLLLFENYILREAKRAKKSWGKVLSSSGGQGARGGEGEGRGGEREKSEILCLNHDFSFKDATPSAHVMHVAISKCY